MNKPNYILNYNRDGEEEKLIPTKGKRASVGRPKRAGTKPKGLHFVDPDICTRTTVPPVPVPSAASTVVPVTEKKKPTLEYPVLNPGFKYMGHQQTTIEWMHSMPEGGILALQMGLGKTLISLTYAVMNYEKYGSLPSLVVCSKTLIDGWIGAINKFFEKGSITYYVLHKDFVGNEEEKSIKEVVWEDLKKYHFVITTYETIISFAKKSSTLLTSECFIRNGKGNIIEVLPSSKPPASVVSKSQGERLIFNVPWANIIADESHKFVNAKSKTFYSMMCLWGNRKWCLTGTPIRNYERDVYSQFRFIGFNKITKLSGFKHKNYVENGLDGWVMNLNYIECGIRLPEPNYFKIECDFDGIERDVYNIILGDTKRAHTDFLAGLGDFMCLLAQVSKLRQFCVASDITRYKGTEEVKDEKKVIELSVTPKGAPFGNNGEKTYFKYYSSKIKKTCEIVKTIPPGEKTIIFVNFKLVIRLAINHMTANGINRSRFSIVTGEVVGAERDRKLEEFRLSEEKDILFMTLKVGSEGLNLMEANNVILLEYVWCPFVLKQAIGRLHRMGQTRRVSIWQIKMKYTIEGYMDSVCLDKLTLTETFFGKEAAAESKKVVAAKSGRLTSALIGNMLRGGN